jgi:tripartite-type tricarboxylate transporter receptor subunit TctC
VPTLSEAGLAGYDATLWSAVVMPAASPPAIVGRLNRELHTVLMAPDVRDSLAAQAEDVEPSTPQELHDRIRRDIDKWRALAAAAGIRAE